MVTTSERKAIAARLAELVVAEDLINPFGGDVELSSDNRSYDFTFSVPAQLNGMVQVYSPKFIRVWAEGKLAAGSFNEVYDSEESARKAVLCLGQRQGYVNSDLYTIPVRQRRS